MADLHKVMPTLMPKITIKQIVCQEHGVSYKTWQLSGYVDHKRVRIRCKTQSEALMRKSEIETQAINAERSSRFIQTRLTAAQISEAESCIDRLAPKYGLTEVTDYFLRHHHDPGFTVSISEATTRFLGAVEGTMRPKTMDQLRLTISQLERFTDNADVHEITSATVERFLQSLRARNGTDKASRQTWNNYRADIHLFLEWCRKAPQRFIAANPVAEVKRFTIEQGAVSVLSADQCVALMDHVSSYRDGQYCRYFALGLFAGIRPGEIKRLAKQPELIDMEGKVIRITAAISKTGKPRQINIRPNLLKWLSRFDGSILPAGSDRELKVIRKKFQLSHDVLRHTFISAHVMAFDSFAGAAIESGNSESIIRDHYLNAIPKSQAEAFWEIKPK